MFTASGVTATGCIEPHTLVAVLHLCGDFRWDTAGHAGCITVYKDCLVLPACQGSPLLCDGAECISTGASTGATTAAQSHHPKPASTVHCHNKM